jgi:hypothetical protein
MFDGVDDGFILICKMQVNLKIFSIPVPRVSCIVSKLDVSNKRKQSRRIRDLADWLICVAVFLFAKLIVALLILKRILFYGK